MGMMMGWRYAVMGDSGVNWIDPRWIGLLRDWIVRKRPERGNRIVLDGLMMICPELSDSLSTFRGKRVRFLTHS